MSLVREQAVLHFREGCSMAELFKHFGPSELKAVDGGMTCRRVNRAKSKAAVPKIRR